MNFKNIAVLSGLVVSGIALSSVLAPANASVLFDSITGDTSNTTTSVVPYGPLADSFSTGATADNLTSVVLSLENDGSATIGTTTLSLFSDSNTNPGSSLTTIATIANSSLTSSLANYTYTLGSPYALAANTRYWIKLSNGSSSTAVWFYTTNGTSTFFIPRKG